MQAILIGVDTNVFLEDTGNIFGLIGYISSMNMRIFIPKTVIWELDKLKTSNKLARIALNKIELECATGKESRILLEPAIKKTAASNDDTIIQSCKEHNVSVILSNDRALLTKAHSEGIPCTDTTNKKDSSLFAEVRSLVQEVTFMEFDINDDQPQSKTHLERAAARKIFSEVLLGVLEKEIGVEMFDFLLPDDIYTSLMAQIRYILKNYQLFKNILPHCAKPLLSKYKTQRSLSEEDIQFVLGLFGLF
ncbi:hypothetical protein NEOKW01_1547 [Nematocida sp. AWRm80]|nr:hypothetical protein NEOKW01_1547 [Nematocida sp. AWRm80]